MTREISSHLPVGTNLNAVTGAVEPVQLCWQPLVLHRAAHAQPA